MENSRSSNEDEPGPYGSARFARPELGAAIASRITADASGAGAVKASVTRTSDGFIFAVF